MKVCIVGRGKVGLSLYRALRAAGVSVETRNGRARARARARAPEERVDTWVLAVPDGRIAEVAARLEVRRGAVVLHCAGARGPEELAIAREHGAHVAGFHPLVSFAGKRVQPLSGATFVAHGDAKATRRASMLARKLGARCIVAPVLGPAYHAAAALLANGGVALAHAATAILVAQGLSQRAAERALAGLIASVARNLEHVGLPGALTGPVVRGDAATVAGHLAALRELSPELADHYLRVQPLVLAAARAAGLDTAHARAVERALTSRGSRTARAPGSRGRSRTTATRAATRRR